MFPFDNLLDPSTSSLEPFVNVVKPVFKSLDPSVNWLIPDTKVFIFKLKVVNCSSVISSIFSTFNNPHKTFSITSFAPVILAAPKGSDFKLVWAWLISLLYSLMPFSSCCFW